MPTTRGIAFPFGRGPTGIPATVSDEDLIKQSLTQIVMTSRGERVMRPDFGSGAQGFVFENNGDLTAQLVVIDLRNAISRFEPRVVVRDISVAQVDSTVEITISYVVISTGATSSVTVPIATPHP